MLSLTNSWNDYFRNPDEGLGTTYERFILHRHFSRLKARYDIHSVLEAPSFGMTGVSGINSLWWAHQDVEVTVVDQSLERMEASQKVWGRTGLKADFTYQPPQSGILPFADRSFDMAWNFAALWHVRDSETYLRELARVAKRALFLCVPNPQNICWVVRPHSASDYELNNIKVDWITSRLAAHGWRLEETGFFDVPPWPDIAMKKEQVLKRLGLSWLAKRMEAKKQEPLCIVDYFTGRSPGMEREVMKYSFLERSPSWLKRIWAHHRFLVFEEP